MKQKEIIVSGMRPTGRLHLGHFFGVLKNWERLQSAQKCYFFVADWHSLTTEYANIREIQDWLREMVIDWLSAGISPEKAVLFVQSRVPEHAELHLLFSMIAPLGWLERVPSYKELQQELAGKDLSTYGFLGYPLLQTADVAIYKATQVPVGQDQVAHIELAREIVRRFNYLYRKIFPEPASLLTETPRLPGLDGRKMSKSYDNAVYLSDPEPEATKKLMNCITDPARIRRQDPGNPDVCTIFSYHKLATDPAKIGEIDRECRRAGIGCVDCKKILVSGMNKTLGPFRERRVELAKKPKQVRDILNAGAEAARKVAQKTLAEANEAMGLGK
ncbi:MAG: tryptophan--tRNA ligase [Deltaproteobacteria bacterium]|nr:tryptophan--tRNA ligase [Deltaproteobacteria bacterium]